jgi:hypothetical protein
MKSGLQTRNPASNQIKVSPWPSNAGEVSFRFFGLIFSRKAIMTIAPKNRITPLVMSEMLSAHQIPPHSDFP